MSDIAASLKSTTEPLPPLRLNGKIYGILLFVTTVAAMLFVSHHPVADLHDKATGLQAIMRLSLMDRLVHGGLIAMMLLLAVGFSGFSWRLGIEHPAVMAGWLSYLIGVVAAMLAAVIDGFIVPDLAAAFAARPMEQPVAYDMLILCGDAIQALTKLGFVLMNLGLVFWGHALMHHRGMARWIAVLGMAIGGFSGVFVLTGAQHLDPPRLMAIMAAQSLWNLTIAIWMIRGLRRPV